MVPKFHRAKLFTQNTLWKVISTILVCMTCCIKNKFEDYKKSMRADYIVEIKKEGKGQRDKKDKKI